MMGKSQLYKSTFSRRYLNTHSKMRFQGITEN